MKTFPPDYRLFIRMRIKSKRISLRQLSRQMGKSDGYLTYSLKEPDMRIGLLLQLSEALHENLLAPYVESLEQTLRPMPSERQMQRELNDAKMKLMRVTEERDRYWEALKNR